MVTDLGMAVSLSFTISVMKDKDFLPVGSRSGLRSPNFKAANMSSIGADE